MLAALHLRQTEFAPNAKFEVALAIRVDETDTRTEVFTGDVGHAVALDAFERLVSSAQESTMLYISDGSFRREIAAVVASFPGLVLADAPRGALRSVLDEAVRALDDHLRFAHRRALEAKAERLESLPELVVATDASKASRRRGVGVACVNAEGGMASAPYPDVESILAGELLAIALAIKKFPDRRLHILTDSKGALSCLRMPRATLLDRHSGEVVNAVNMVHQRSANRQIRYSWVRGHSGHELNEIADRLALAARRNYDARISTKVSKQIARNILDQFSFAAQAA
jgi:hypothetical protein